MKSHELERPHSKKVNGASPPAAKKKGAASGQKDAPSTEAEDRQRKRRLAHNLAQALHGITRPIFMMAVPRLIVHGPPVSRRKQRKLGITNFTPGLGYGKRPCSCCREHLWLGPNQLAQLEANQRIEVMCMTCTQPIFERDGAAVLTHLGGRGPEYRMQNGRRYGPPEEFGN